MLSSPLTALNGLRKCGVTKGTRVLINRGTGGVGTLEKSEEAFELAEKGKPRGKIIIRI